MANEVIILVLSVILTNLITFHVTKVKARKRAEKLVDGNIEQIIEHQNIIVRALANSNGFGDKFNTAYAEELKKTKQELKIIQE